MTPCFHPMLLPHSLSSTLPPGSRRCPLSFLFLFPFRLSFSSRVVLRLFLPVQRGQTGQCAHLRIRFLPLFAARPLFFAEHTDKLDVCSLFQMAFQTHAGIGTRTTEKAEIPLGAAFYFQFVFICPSAPHGCLWERVSTCFIGRYCVSGSKSVFTHRCESRTSGSVPLLSV